MNVIQKNELKIFTHAYTDKLFRDLISTNNYDNYLLDKFPYEEKYPIGNSEIFINSRAILDPLKSDFENSKILFEALPLNETQASDPRLWTFLTHAYFWQYMRERWPVEKAEKPVNRVRNRYFLRSLNLESLTRNGISRLWWYGYLTHDEKRENKFELTEIMLSRADLVVGITERALGCNKNIRTAILEFLKQHPEIASNENRTRELLKGINLIGGVKSLPFLEIPEIQEHLNYVNENAIV